jgi:hypothetical protein
MLLMYVTHEDRWLDLSLRNLTGDWPHGLHKGPHRVEQCFAGVNGGGLKALICLSRYRKSGLTDSQDRRTVILYYL